MPKFLLLAAMVLAGQCAFSQASEDPFLWPDSQKVAVSLCYDDALDSQLDFALPALEKYQLKATFYLVSSSPSLSNRMEDWKAVAQKGHELGNHSVYHPCRASLPGRDWVPPHQDLDAYSMMQIKEEIRTANTFLQALDGQSERTFNPPCGDRMIEGEDYIEEISDQFVAVKGHETPEGFALLHVPFDISGDSLISLIQQAPEGVGLINLVFHGVGGDYLTTSAEAHEELLRFLSKNEDLYYVDTYLNIMRYRNLNMEER
ncbi:polysaccharide deacetylase family protein [Pontibacter sp. G13]|uniref:polysaccharide deacetylase family protein n=1 Tax=Pontibacter sp. G13 TaxID=3074898 RepID=UPI00288B68B5|nr:polysaccharide deacetylase family protein [Pontibacter sp. G13]WNJ19063.1 polysaccharide deacetylase family protein [Pontibacter sp. G13]